MSNPIMTYNGAAIDALRGDIIATHSQFNAKLSDLKSEVANLVASWDQGAATEAYQVEQRKWDEAAAGLNDILNSIGQAVGNGNDDVHAADRSAAGKWGG
ncbi:MAG: WXG100 family type VII secretion target [Mycobacteriaceae bacterium]